MRVQSKLVLLVLVLLVGALSAVIWKTQDLLVHDKLASTTDSFIKQLAPIRRLVQEKMDEEKTKLVRFASVRSKSSSSATKPFGDFEVVSLVKPNDSRQWAPQWIEKGPSAQALRWPEGQEITLLKSLPYSRVRDGEIIWVRLSDPQGAPIYATLLTVEIRDASDAQLASSGKADELASQLPDSVDYSDQQKASMQKAVLVGFSSVNPLASVSSDYIGSTHTVYVVDDRGYVASHTNNAYVGAKFTEDPIVKDILKKERSTATGEFEDIESRSVVAHYERVGQTNLAAIVAVPRAFVVGVVDRYVQAAMAIGAGAIAIALILSWLVGQKLSSQLTAEAKGGLTPDSNSGAEADSSSDGAHAEVAFAAMESVESSAESSDGVTQDEVRIINDQLLAERKAAFEYLYQGISKEFKEPLLSILGHAQLIKTKTEESEIRSHAESIERESRNAKEMMERLRSFGGNLGGETATGGKFEKVQFSLQEALEDALSQHMDELAGDGIEVIKEFAANPLVRGSKKQFEVAIGHLIDNAREAMRLRDEKKLKFQILANQDEATLIVSDTGVGMSRDVKERAFEPFFKTFDTPKSMGLGLAFVDSALKLMNGRYEIESTPGEGAVFRFTIPAEVSKSEDTIMGTVLLGADELLSESESDDKDEVIQEFVSVPGIRNLETGTSIELLCDDAAANDDDDDDDEDEVFTSVSLGKKASAEPKVSTSEVSVSVTASPEGEIVAVADEVPVAPKKKSFQVKIRRPKLNS